MVRKANAIAAEAGEDAPKGGVGRPSLRIKLMDCALDIIAEEGLAALTYDSLSVRTGVSKGGLLYHFANKAVLLESITEHLIVRYAAARRAATDALPDAPGRELKGYAIASLHNRAKSDGASARLKMSGQWNNRAGKAYSARRFREMAADVEFERAAVVHLAVEGLWYMELSGVSPFTAIERRRIVMQLLRLADGDAIGRPIRPVKEAVRRGK